MKERFVLPAEIRKQAEEFLDLMEEFSTLKREQHVDRTAKAKLAELAKKLDCLCALLSAYYQSQASRWAERRQEINKQVR